MNRKEKEQNTDVSKQICVHKTQNTLLEFNSFLRMAEPKDFWPVLGKTPVEGYMLSTGFGGNGVIEVPAATRDLAKLIMRDESTPLLENWAFERLLED